MAASTSDAVATPGRMTTPRDPAHRTTFALVPGATRKWAPLATTRSACTMERTVLNQTHSSQMIGCNRTQSNTIERNQTQSNTIERNQTQSDAIGGNQTQSNATRRNQTQSDVIRRNQTQSDVISMPARWRGRCPRPRASRAREMQSRGCSPRPRPCAV